MSEKVISHKSRWKYTIDDDRCYDKSIYLYFYFCHSFLYGAFEL